MASTASSSFFTLLSSYLPILFLFIMTISTSSAQQSFRPRQLLSADSAPGSHLDVEHHQASSAFYDFLSAVQLVCGIVLVLILILAALLKLIYFLRGRHLVITSGPPLPITNQPFVMQQAPLAPPQPHNVLSLLSFTEQISIDDDDVDRY